MNKAKSNLLCAKWVYPQYLWFSKSDGTAEAYTHDNPYEVADTFDITRPLDCDAVRIKLQRDHGWRISKSPDGQWRAEKHGEWHERPILEDLVVLMVGRVKK
jgi:hypothetical protein